MRLMVGHKVKALMLSAATIAAICWHAPASADLIDPTDSNLAPFTIQVGDFQTVSLNQAQAFYGKVYEVQSSPGQLGNYVIVGTGPSGINGVNPTYSGSMDLPYLTPSGKGGERAYPILSNRFDQASREHPMRRYELHHLS